MCSCQETSHFFDSLVDSHADWYNHLLLLLLVAVILAHFGTLGDEQTCPISSSYHGVEALVDAVEKRLPPILQAADAATDEAPPQEAGEDLSIEDGLSYTLPPVAMYALGGLLTLVGLLMLVWGARMRRAIIGTAIVGALAAAAQYFVNAFLLGEPPYSLAAALSLDRDGINLGSVRLDVECTGATLVVLGAISLGLHALAQRGFQRALFFLEGVACAVLAVRVAADFAPRLLAPMRVGVVSVGHLTVDLSKFEGDAYLGYPLLPFWALAAPLALLLGILPNHPAINALTTSFLGAFATAKGVRTLSDAYHGRTALELAGGDSVAADPIQGGVQLGLFVVGVWLHGTCCAGREHGEESLCESCCCGLCSLFACCCRGCGCGGCLGCGGCWCCCEEPHPAAADYSPACVVISLLYYGLQQRATPPRVPAAPVGCPCTHAHTARPPRISRVRRPSEASLGGPPSHAAPTPYLPQPRGDGRSGKSQFGVKQSYSGMI